MEKNPRIDLPIPRNHFDVFMQSVHAASSSIDVSMVRGCHNPLTGLLWVELFRGSPHSALQCPRSRHPTPLLEEGGCGRGDISRRSWILSYAFAGSILSPYYLRTPSLSECFQAIVECSTAPCWLHPIPILRSLLAVAAFSRRSTIHHQMPVHPTSGRVRTRWLHAIRW